MAASRLNPLLNGLLNMPALISCLSLITQFKIETRLPVVPSLFDKALACFFSSKSLARQFDHFRAVQEAKAIGPFGSQLRLLFR
jgi:hypothetical protein